MLIHVVNNTHALGGYLDRANAGFINLDHVMAADIRMQRLVLGNEDEDDRSLMAGSLVFHLAEGCESDISLFGRDDFEKLIIPREHIKKFATALWLSSEEVLRLIRSARTHREDWIRESDVVIDLANILDYKLAGMGLRVRDNVLIEGEEEGEEL